MDTKEQEISQAFGLKRIGFGAMLKGLLARFREDSLFQNSVYLMLCAAVMAGFGFIFWVITARVYTPAQVGFATALITATTLLSNFSMLEFGTGLVRYLPKSLHKHMMINTAIIAVSAATLVVSGAYLLGIHRFAPSFAALTSRPTYAGLFLIFMVLVSLNTLTDSVFIAYRAAKYNLIVYTCFGIVKIALPLALVRFGSFGIFFAYTGSVIVSLVLSFFFMRRHFRYRFRWAVEKRAATKMVKFSLGNYVASTMMTTPTLIIPTIIVGKLGPESSAYFYMAATIAALLYIIPLATTRSLLAESSHNEEAIHTFVKSAVRLTAALLLPATLLFMVAAPYVLAIFGPAYAEHSAALLRVMSLTGIFLAISLIWETIFKVRHEISKLIVMNTAYLIVTIGLALLLLHRGVLWASLALLAGQVFLCLEYWVVLMWQRLYRARMPRPDIIRSEATSK